MKKIIILDNKAFNSSLWRYKSV